MKLFLLLPTLTLATIDVQFSGTIDFQHGNVRGIFDATKYTNYEGSSLTDRDLNVINELNTEVLKDAAERYNGKRPDKVYVTCPEDQRDLCRENGWKELKKRIVPLEVNAIQVISKTVLVTKKAFGNYEDSPKKTVIDVSQMVQNKLSSEWKSAENTASDKVHLDLKFRINCGKKEIDNTFIWGKKTDARLGDLLQEKEEAVIPPNKELLAEMHAKIGLVQFAVDYNITLTGEVVAVYSNMYKGKRYHNLDIDNLLATKGVSSSTIVTQIVSYQFYYGALLKIVESEKQVSGKPVMTASNNKHEVKDENARPKVEGLGNIKTASKDELKEYIIKDIEDDMYLGLTETETREDKSVSSEESVEN